MKNFFRKVAFGIGPNEKVPNDPLNWSLNQINQIPELSWKGKIDGNLNCDTLEIYGEFTGNGEVRVLQVCKGGKVKGSLSYNTIVVEVGAIISGPMKPIDKDPVLLIENK